MQKDCTKTAPPQGNGKGRTQSPSGKGKGKGKGKGGGKSQSPAKQKCKYWDAGTCRYGTECKYGHPGDCRDWLSKKACSRAYCNFRHAPDKKGTALVAVNPKAMDKAKAKDTPAADRATIPAPGKKKLAAAEQAAKTATALVASMEAARAAQS